ncbi:translin-associated protein X [Zerene cesonia]|uniref:translin-associated protein X n=1 Tax=Zerene cesonia TaxID=33412 RepID=UPI0018E558BD|nr:translin-associated protein X [Zerene cesonia]XP_038223476.1 translin-associated protein X [Zerene cesonia]XP_038223477.1 translin-associated protein X [Zerene cesonia]
MSGRGGKFRGNRNKNHHTLSSVARETAISLPDDSPVLQMFKSAAQKLNDRQDRHERLVKLSRDITIESKRIIFLLHSSITKESTEKAINEANERIQKLIQGPFKSIGLELENSPAYLHSRAITAGFQEFIEAYTLCSFMEKKLIITWPEVQKKLVYEVEDRSVTTMLPQLDYMLGLADLTGELMRKAINSISSGDSEECFDSCQAVRDLYTGYLGLFGSGKELARKMSATRSNVFKVESAVYALRVRGGEAPPTLLLANQPDWEHNHSDDEGFY